jgi:hypothetical protein
MTDAFENAERRVLAALLLDWYRPGDRLLGSEELQTDYDVNINEHELAAIFADLNRKGWILRVADKEKVAAVLTDEGYKPARTAILRELGNPTSFDVNWEAKEVYSEAPAEDWFPIPNWWKWYTLGEGKVAPSAFEPARLKRPDWHLIVAIAGVAVAVLFGILTLRHP